MADIINHHRKGIRIAEVFNTLDLSPGENPTGRDLGYANAGAHSRTNPWARYKPVRPLTDHPSPLTDAERAAVQWGIAPFSGSTPISLSHPLNITAALATFPTLTWQHYPRPGSSDWKRLTDWDGYDPLSIPPIAPPGDFYLYVNDTSLTVTARQTGIQSATNLSLADFPYLASRYLALIIWQESRTDGSQGSPTFITASSTIADGGDTIDIPANDLIFAHGNNNTTHYLLCAASAPQTSLASSTVANFLPLPASEPLTGEIALSSDSPIHFTILGISERNVATASDLTPFQISDPDAGEDYFGTARGLWLHCSVQSLSGKTETIPVGNIALSTRRNFVTPDTNTTDVSISPTIYSQSSPGASPLPVTSSFTVPASGSITLILDATSLVNANTYGQATAPVRSTVNLNLNIRHTATGTLTATAGRTSINIHTAAGTLHLDGPGRL